MVDKRIVERIKKLFRLSNSPNEHEAAIALEKAYKLMLEYNIPQEAILDIKGKVIGTTVRFSRWRESLITHICWLNIVYPVKACQGYLFFGQETNVFIAGEMYKYLERAIIRIARRDIRKNAKWKYRENFKLGMAINLSCRIDEMIKKNQGWIRIREQVKEIEKLTSSLFEERNLDSVSKLKRNSQALLKGFEAGEDVSLSPQIRVERSLIGILK